MKETGVERIPSPGRIHHLNRPGRRAEDLSTMARKTALGSQLHNQQETIVLQFPDAFLHCAGSSIRITERTNIQFRAEAFNATNTFNFYQQQPNASLTSSSFGTVVPANVSSGRSSAPRYFQFSLKFNF